MIINTDGKTFRNLQEQVQYLTGIFGEVVELNKVGIRVIGKVLTVDDLPEPSLEEFDFGDTYLVGTSEHYEMYTLTRPFEGQTTPQWLDIGLIAERGPKGDKGDTGEKGDTGNSTKWMAGVGNPNLFGIQGNENDFYLDVSNGNVYMYSGSAWVQKANIKGETGAQGPQGIQGEKGDTGEQGPKGDTGDVGGWINIRGILNSADQLPSPVTLNDPTAAYLVGDNRDLYIQVGATKETRMWTNVGQINVATYVTVDGKFQNVWDADVKADVTYVDESVSGLAAWSEVEEALEDYQPKLTAGSGISIDEATNTISSTVPSNVVTLDTTQNIQNNNVSDGISKSITYEYHSDTVDNTYKTLLHGGWVWVSNDIVPKAGVTDVDEAHRRSIITPDEIIFQNNSVTLAETGRVSADKEGTKEWLSIGQTGAKLKVGVDKSTNYPTPFLEFNNKTIATTNDIPSTDNFVTLADNQEITGTKKFSNGGVTTFAPANGSTTGTYSTVGYDGFTTRNGSKFFKTEYNAAQYSNGFGYKINGGSGTKYISIPDKTGTLATTDDIKDLPSYLSTEASYNYEGEEPILLYENNAILMNQNNNTEDAKDHDGYNTHVGIKGGYYDSTHDSWQEPEVWLTRNTDDWKWVRGCSLTQKGLSVYGADDWAWNLGYFRLGDTGYVELALDYGTGIQDTLTFPRETGTLATKKYTHTVQLARNDGNHLIANVSFRLDTNIPMDLAAIKSFLSNHDCTSSTSYYPATGYRIVSNSIAFMIKGIFVSGGYISCVTEKVADGSIGTYNATLVVNDVVSD